MTIPTLKRSMDRRFDRVQRSMDRRFDQVQSSMDRRFDSLDRRKAEQSAVDRVVNEVRAEIAIVHNEITKSAAETRRHFDVVADSLRDDLRMFADAIGVHSGRLNQHETRMTRLESRSV